MRHLANAECTGTPKGDVVGSSVLERVSIARAGQSLSFWNDHTDTDTGTRARDDGYSLDAEGHGDGA